MSDMSKLKSFSVPEEAFENFQAASIHKQMDLNTQNLSLPIPACSSNVEISSTIEDEVQSVNITSISQETPPSMEPSKRRVLKRKAHTMPESITIDSTIKDQQVSTTQESSEPVDEEDSLQEKEVLLEGKSRRLRGRPPKRKIGRHSKQTALNEKQTIQKLPSNKHESTMENLITEDNAMTENQVVDSTTSHVPDKTNINNETRKKTKIKENKCNVDVGNVFSKTENIVNSNSCNIMDTVESNKDNISPDCIGIKDNIESDDDPDEISLSKLKQTLSDLDNENALVKPEGANLQNLSKVKVFKSNKNAKQKSSKIPHMVDLGCSIDSVVDEESVKIETDEPQLIDNTSSVETNATSSETNATSCETNAISGETNATSGETSATSSGRPKRKRKKVNLHYDECSDEDPFANVELSDDDGDPNRSKKGGKRYYSDDEYVPEQMLKKKISTDSDVDKDDNELKKPRKKRNSKGMKKKLKASDSEIILDTSTSFDVSVIQDDEDMNLSVTDSNISKSSNKSNSWGNTNEFESFLAKRIQGTNLKIKRVTSKENNAITHLEIPVIDSYTKTADVYSQTNHTKLSTAAVQTTSHLDIQMEKNVPLTQVQSEKACEFLTDVVKATSKLGELMTQKSDDFVQKKINTSNLTSTVKMDHYVKKSLLLFKLAKDSIMDIEETLAEKYEDFLKENKLSQYTSVPKLITPTVALKDGDSDCEIVEETFDHKKQNVKEKTQSKFNLKTVFLNKELSIKIAKKPSEEHKLKNKINIKGKNSMWISDSVLVKKVKPTQSFLAQDSRNKKPPDTYVTNEMVSDFFREHYQATALSACAHLLSAEWQNWRNLKIWENRVWCYYFNIEPTSINNNLRYIQSSVNTVNLNDNSNANANCENTKFVNPKSLVILSINALQKKMIQIKNIDLRHKEISHKSDAITDVTVINNAEKLSNLCLHKINYIFNSTHPSIDTVPKPNNSLLNENVTSLRMLCYHQLIRHYFTFNISRESDKTWIRTKECGNITCRQQNTSLLSISGRKLQLENILTILESSNSLTIEKVELLQTLCYRSIIRNSFPHAKQKKNDTLMRIQGNNIENFPDNIADNNIPSILESSNSLTIEKVELLQTLCYRSIIRNSFPHAKQKKNDTLMRLQGNNIENIPDNIADNNIPSILESSNSLTIEKVELLQTLCYRSIIRNSFPHAKQRKIDTLMRLQGKNIENFPDIIADNNIPSISESSNSLTIEKVEPLKTLCYRSIIRNSFPHAKQRKIDTLMRLQGKNIENFPDIIADNNIPSISESSNSLTIEKVEPLKTLCYRSIIRNFFPHAKQKNNHTLMTLQGKNINLPDIIADNNIPSILESSNSLTFKIFVPLQTLCYQSIVRNCFLLAKQKKNDTLIRLQGKTVESLPFFEVNTLLSLCLNVIWDYQKHNIKFESRNKKSENEDSQTLSRQQVETLFSLCFKVIQHNQDANVGCVKKINKIRGKNITIKQDKNIDIINNKCKNGETEQYALKSLKHIALSSLVQIMTNSKNMEIGDLNSNIKQNHENCLGQIKSKHDEGNNITETAQCPTNLLYVKPLFQLCFETLKLIYDSENALIQNSGCNSIQINSVNTVPEEMFFSIEDVSTHFYDDNVNNDDDEHIYDDHLFDNGEQQSNVEDCNFESKLSMKEICPQTPNKNYSCFDDEEHTFTIETNQPSPVAQIKIEPIENYVPDNITEIKTEPDFETNMLPQIQCIQAAKLENCFPSPNKTGEVLSTFRDEFDAFESNICQKTIERVIGDKNKREQKVFSQSSLRIRRQFEPDSEDENDNTMSLLVPDTYVPLSNEIVQNVMKNSNHVQEKDGKNEKKKKKKDKRIEKRKNKQKPPVSKDIDMPEQQPLDNDNDVIKKKLHDNIIQEKESESSDSESLSVLSRRKNKEEEESRRGSENDLQTNSNQKATTDEIQCNDVDSTQETNENEVSAQVSKKTRGLQEYNKYINDLYSKLKRKATLDATEDLTDVISNEGSQEETEEYYRSFSPAYNSDEPVELLQCEPTLPLDDIVEKRKSGRKTKNTKTLKSNVDHSDISVIKDSDLNENTIEANCNGNDIKLCQQAIVALEKLPEKLVETYFKSQGIEYKDKGDNTHESLGICPSIDQNKSKRFKTTDGSNTLDKIDIIIENDDESSDSHSLTHFGEDSNNESLPDTQFLKQSICGSPSKSKPQDCDEMELENLVKKEEEENKIKEESSDEELQYTKSLRSRKLSKKERKGAKPQNDDAKAIENDTALLTADKMMKKDLLLLHSPVVEDKEVTPNSSKYPIRNKRKSDGTVYKVETNPDDYSSSEEEKQWVTTKEKLLKRLLKKNDDTSMDAAKRAKVINEFIARCKTIESRKRYSRSGRSRRNFLERQKQLNVLSKELFGESSNETYQLGKKSSQRFGKGRRNIRRVIDKKSLARSTLLANIEEIERKRRLLHRQNKLREILGCEEGVNVVVINDEVCLEYDFEENRPVVTVHPFFTQVMKAHQYEGVKFMWDACFESLELVGAGHAGGGCILAHCMGLGKTLQVLALLHTVLTHPGVGMKRVLVVCPLSTVLNWVDEINKWMKPVNNNIKVFELSKLKKTYERAYQLEDWYTGGGIFIIGYEMFRNLSTLDAILDNVRPTIVNKIRTALLDPGPDIIVCDEGHLLKNDSSVLAVAISRVTTKRRIVLTGTPMQNNLREYYCMVNFVKPNLLGLYSEYANRFENPIMNGQHRDSREEDIKLMKARTHILHKVLEGCLQRQEAAVLYPYLPKKYEYTAFIPLTTCQTELYKHYLKHASNTKQAKHNVLRDYHVLQKIWTHPQVLHNFHLKSRDPDKVKVEKFEDDLACEDLTASEDVKPSQTEVWWLEYLEGGNMLDSLESSNKLYAVFRILDECIALGDKVLIFSTSLFTMDTLEYFLKKIKKWSLGHEYYRLDGSVPAEVRQNWCREFNSPNNHTTNLFLISTRAGCLGLNMTAANRVIILDTSWNPAHDLQSIFRVYRFGQKKDCYIYRLVAMGTMEQKIYERAVTKQAVACRVVDSQQIDRHYNMDELAELYNFDETGAGVESGVAAGVTDVALLRVARDAPLHAVYEHDSLLRDSHEQQLPEHERAAAWRQFEMEQGHSHMANLENNLPKTPTKKIHGHDYAMSPSMALDSADSVNTKPKSKRGRKPKIKPVQAPVKEGIEHENVVRSEANQTIDECNMMTEVQQIKNILVQRNIQHEYSNIEKVEGLVQRVQRIVEARLKGENLFDEPLVEDIANVFLQMKGKYLASSVQTPITSADNEYTSEGNLKVYKNNKRKLETDVNESNKNHDTDSFVEIKKRKAAIRAKEYINSLNLENTKAADDDESWSQEENIGTLDTRQNIENQHDSNNEMDNAVDLRYADKISIEDDSSADKTEKSNTLMVEIPDDDELPEKSIVLSDDETVVEIDKSEKSKKNTTKDGDKDQSDENKGIPLHASLLMNQYFINIVAYKYLEGNPMLDKDAALHAARYSANKALKEIHETGNALYSGPLYDIAVASIGIETLKRLQNISLKSKTESDSSKQKHATKKDKRETSQIESNQSKDDVNKSKRVYKNKFRQKSKVAKESVRAKRQERKSSTESDDLVLISDEVILEKPRNKTASNKITEREPPRTVENKTNNALSTVSAPATAPTFAPAASKTFCTSSESNRPTEQDLVVPIQMFKSSSNTTITMTRPPTPLTDECILPDDDDDVCYVTDTAATAIKNSTSSLLVSNVRSGDTFTHKTPLPPKKKLQPKTTPNKKSLPKKTPKTSSIHLDNELEEAIKQMNDCHKKKDANTICLDSDDEDIIIAPTETLTNTVKNATCSQAVSQNPVVISVPPTNTIAPPSNTSHPVTGPQISNTTVNNTLMGIINPSPRTTTLSISDLQGSSNITSVLNTNANSICKPGDVIKINNNGQIYLLNPQQTVLTNTPQTTTPSTVVYTANSKVGKIAIKALKITPTAVPKKVPSVSRPKKFKPAVPSTTPTLTIYPLQPIKTKNKPPSVVQENVSIETYPSMKVKSADFKQDKDVVPECLDLTDTDNDVVKVTTDKQAILKTFSHISNIKSNVSVVGSPKDFMFVRSGDKTKLETTISRKRKDATMPALGQLEFKKKPTSQEVAGPSKTKMPPFKKLTLQDFNIDKIDEDIIELE